LPACSVVRGAACAGAAVRLNCPPANITTRPCCSAHHRHGQTTGHSLAPGPPRDWNNNKPAHGCPPTGPRNWLWRATGAAPLHKSATREASIRMGCSFFQIPWGRETLRR
jgi:hypothetical protein